MVESEKTAKWQYTRHCEDLSVEIKKLREEVRRYIIQTNDRASDHLEGREELIQTQFH